MTHTIQKKHRLGCRQSHALSLQSPKGDVMIEFPPGSHSIDNHKYVKAIGDQIEGRLEHADMGLNSHQDDLLTTLGMKR